MLFALCEEMLATLAKICFEDSVEFKLVNGGFISSSVEDKSLANVGLVVAIGANRALRQ